MLNNCSVRLETDNDVSYWFKGDKSMLDYTEYSLFKGDILKCESLDLLHLIVKGNLRIKKHDLFTLHLFTGEIIVAGITGVKIDLLELKLRFLNPDKSMYPDQVLHFDDVMSLYKVADVHRLLSSMNNLGPAL